MIPEFEQDGSLPPGIHWATWQEVINRFGYTPHRQDLLLGLKRALDALRIAGCNVVFLDGSFVTAKRMPNDFDACWDSQGVDPNLLDPLLLDFSRGRAAQKAFYRGELFPAQFREGGGGSTFLEFFQIQKETGRAKGIVAIEIGTLP
jgi:hypothetical protein